jgi:L-glyceraldehyde 3-phosphate reductase
MAMAWVLRLPVMTSVLIGASRVSQLEENIKALDLLDFDPAELSAIDEVLADSGS